MEVPGEQAKQAKEKNGVNTDKLISKQMTTPLHPSHRYDKGYNELEQLDGIKDKKRQEYLDNKGALLQVVNLAMVCTDLRLSLKEFQVVGPLKQIQC